MKKDVIILTSGMSGSSVLAGLISQAGYWLGDETSKAPFETYENKELIDLNIQILRATNYFWRDVVDIPGPFIDRISCLSSHLELYPYKKFVEKCENHHPYLWKDPRLSYTIYFWEQFLDLSRCKFFLMTRDVKQSWTGGILRAKRPIALRELEIIEKNCIQAAKKFAEKHGVSFLHITFEDLIAEPERTLKQINDYIGANLDLTCLQKIYKGSLRKVRWSLLDFWKANLYFLYFKYISKDVIRFPRN